MHPNATGYDKMAAAWFAALRAVPGSIGNPAGPGNSGPVDTAAWYTLVNRNSGKAIDVYNLSTADGARITQWSRNNGTQQQWQFVSSGNGYYRLKSRLSGKVLDVTAKSTADGAAITQWSDNNGANQQFSIQTIDGYIQLISRNSGKAVEVQGASTTDGGNIVQYSDWNGSNQQWQLVRAELGARVARATAAGGASPDVRPPAWPATDGAAVGDPHPLRLGASPPCRDRRGRGCADPAPRTSPGGCGGETAIIDSHPVLALRA